MAGIEATFHGPPDTHPDQPCATGAETWTAHLTPHPVQIPLGIGSAAWH
ncbi:hypothetical protein ACFWBF_18095 [Streptomyces sp. NPDC060028]